MNRHVVKRDFIFIKGNVQPNTTYTNSRCNYNSHSIINHVFSWYSVGIFFLPWECQVVEMWSVDVPSQKCVCMDALQTGLEKTWLVGWLVGNGPRGHSPKVERACEQFPVGDGSRHSSSSRSSGNGRWPNVKSGMPTGIDCLLVIFIFHSLCAVSREIISEIDSFLYITVYISEIASVL